MLLLPAGRAILCWFLVPVFCVCLSRYPGLVCGIHVTVTFSSKSRKLISYLNAFVSSIRVISPLYVCHFIYCEVMMVQMNE